MKLRNITLIALFLFIAFFAVLAFLDTNTKFLDFSKTYLQSNNNKETTIPKIDTTGLTLEEIAKHNSVNDCYLIVSGAVYDVTSYINQHPGGVKNITSRCGSEASSIFSAIHSNFAWNLLKNFYVSDVAKNSATVVNSASNVARDLEKIKSRLQDLYPGAEIVDVKPKNSFYVAKIIKNNALYEIHINSQGEVLKEEVQNDEQDWSNWEDDEDD